MRQSISIKCSSFMHDCDLYIPDGYSPPVVTPVTTGWRASGYTCVLNTAGKKTGYAHVTTLEEYDLTTGVATGNTTPNVPSHPNYVADYLDTVNCAPQTSNLLAFSFFNATPVTCTVNIKGRFGSISKTFNVPAGVTVNDSFPQDTYDMYAKATYIAGYNYQIWSAQAIGDPAATYVTLSGVTLPVNTELHTVNADTGETETPPAGGHGSGGSENPT